MAVALAHEVSVKAYEAAILGECGRRIRRLREARGLTLDGLSQKTGLSPGRLSAIENGKGGTPIWNVVRLAQALEVPITALFPKPSTALGRLHELLELCPPSLYAHLSEVIRVFLPPDTRAMADAILAAPPLETHPQSDG